MKTSIKAIIAMIAAIPAWSTSGFAADACEPIMKAIDASEHAERRRVRTVMLKEGKPVDVPEGIIVPEGTYQKTGDRWIRNPFSANNAMIKKLSGTPTYTDCKSLGGETLDGVATNVYSGKVTVKGGLVGDGESDGKLWVAKSDGLPRKVESRLRNKDTTVTQFYSYGPDIQAPPTSGQEASSGGDAPKGGLEIPAGIGDAIKGFFKR